jgi:hypothetical protein
MDVTSREASDGWSAEQCAGGAQARGLENASTPYDETVIPTHAIFTVGLVAVAQSSPHPRPSSSLASDGQHQHPDGFGTHLFKEKSQ